MLMPDGSVISNSIPVQFATNTGSMINGNTTMCVAKIDEILYCDDPKNSTFGTNISYVEYNCTVVLGPLTGHRIFNVRDYSGGGSGGVNCSSETVLTPTTNTTIDGSIDTQLPDKIDGALVTVSFVDGSRNTPVIINILKHPKSSLAATKEDGIRSVSDFNNVRTEISSDGGFQVVNTGSQSALESLTSSVTEAATSAVTEAVQSVQTAAEDLIDKYAALPDIDLSDEIATLTSMKDSAASIVGDPKASLESVQDMASGLASFAAAPLNIAQFKDVTASIGQLGSLVGFTKPIAIKLSSAGDASIGNELQKMKVDKMGQAAIESVGSTGQKFLMGGVSTMVSPIVNMNAASAFNVNSILTKIGKSCVPTARIGSVSVGSNSAGPVISKIIGQTSVTSMV
jgi:hypothetical protein